MKKTAEHRQFFLYYIVAQVTTRRYNYVMDDANSTIRWVFLGLCVVTIIFVMSIPTLTISVLFPEIAADLDLDAFQLGIAWGTLSLTGMFIGLIGGSLGDWFGARRVVGIACLFAGVFGALRGLVPSYSLLLLSFLFYGFITPSIPPNLHKAGAYFFPKQRGVSTGVISMGFAFGLFLGARYMAAWISPTVGGWRNVMFLFGVAGFLIGLIWLFVVPERLLPTPEREEERPFFSAFQDRLRHVIKLRELWLIALGAMMFWGCYKGFSGYLPTYLENIGWTRARAGITFGRYFLVSLFFALPLSLVSDRLKARKVFMVLCLLFTGVGILLVGLQNETLIVIGVIMAGLVFDGFMAIHQAAIMDVDGVGYQYAGTALGVGFFMKEVGGFLSPPIGNWLAQFGGHVPFLFWGVLALIGMFIFMRLPSK